MIKGKRRRHHCSISPQSKTCPCLDEVSLSRGHQSRNAAGTDKKKETKANTRKLAVTIRPELECLQKSNRLSSKLDGSKSIKTLDELSTNQSKSWIILVENAATLKKIC
jgi:hypothetical protein